MKNKKSKDNKKKRPYIKWIVLAFAVVYTVISDQRLKVETYSLKSDKVKENIRIAFISDLHNKKYGKNQSQLVAEIDMASPDIVIFGGDTADSVLDKDIKDSVVLAENLVKKYPCYYTVGNHEYRRGDVDKIKEKFSQIGLKVLEGNGDIITVNGQKIEICGIFKPDSIVADKNITQLEAVTAKHEDSHYRVLIAHYPERLTEYAEGGFDLVLSGHAHGGQVRIPFLLKNGMYAPNQGLFPKYTCGIHKNGDTTQIISRGLCRYTPFFLLPRVFNRPELSIVDIDAE